jgi:hypothetical protein
MHRDDIATFDIAAQRHRGSDARHPVRDDLPERRAVASMKRGRRRMGRGIVSNRSTNVQGARMQREAMGARAGWAAQACVGLGLAAALASGCEEDEADPVQDNAPLGELSPAQMESLCGELRDARERQPPPSCAPAQGDSYALIQANPAQCEGLESVACEVTAGELRACEQARLADPCGDGDAATAACAPLIQRGCAARGWDPTWTNACPDLAAAVAPFEGIYELSGHSVNETSCDAEGASALEAPTQQLFVVVTLMLYGAPIGRIESCDDVEHCLQVGDSLRRYSQRTDPEQVASGRESLSRAVLCHPTIEGALESEVVSAEHALKEELCKFEQTQEVITRAQDGTLRLEARSLAWQTPLGDGSCSLDEPPPNLICQLEIYEARRVSAL